MDETVLIRFSVINVITIGLMGLAGYALLKLASLAYQTSTGGAAI